MSFTSLHMPRPQTYTRACLLWRDDGSCTQEESVSLTQPIFQHIHWESKLALISVHIREQDSHSEYLFDEVLIQGCAEYMDVCVYLDRAQAGNTSGSFHCIALFPVEPTYSPQLHSHSVWLNVAAFHFDSTNTPQPWLRQTHTTLFFLQQSVSQIKLRPSGWTTSVAVHCQTTPPYLYSVCSEYRHMADQFNRKWIISAR